jgi:hypothetical protein
MHHNHADFPLFAPILTQLMKQAGKMDTAVAVRAFADASIVFFNRVEEKKAFASDVSTMRHVCVQSKAKN